MTAMKFADKFREEIEEAVETYERVTGNKIPFETMAELLAGNRDAFRVFLYKPGDGRESTDAILELVEGDNFGDGDYDYEAAPKRQKVSMERFIEKFTPEIALCVLLLKTEGRHTASFEELTHFLYDHHCTRADIVCDAHILHPGVKLSKKDREKADWVIDDLVENYDLGREECGGRDYVADHLRAAA